MLWRLLYIQNNPTETKCVNPSTHPPQPIEADIAEIPYAVTETGTYFHLFF